MLQYLFHHYLSITYVSSHVLTVKFPVYTPLKILQNLGLLLFLSINTNGLSKNLGGVNDTDSKLLK